MDQESLEQLLAMPKPCCWEHYYELCAYVFWGSRASHVRNVVLHHQDAKEENLGFFLASLVNNCWDRNVVIPRTTKPLICIGYKNRRHRITVEGDAGYFLGLRMSGGSVHVKGNCRDAGEKMTGGTIIVDGGASEYVGTFMEGGVIRFNGDNCKTGPDFMKGSIHWNGKRVAHKNWLDVLVERHYHRADYDNTRQMRDISATYDTLAPFYEIGHRSVFEEVPESSPRIITPLMAELNSNS